MNRKLNQFLEYLAIAFLVLSVFCWIMAGLTWQFGPMDGWNLFP